MEQKQEQKAASKEAVSKEAVSKEAVSKEAVSKPVDKNFRYMVRIANTDLDGKKHILPALKKIKGVGIMYANFACNQAGVDKTKKAGYLDVNEMKRLEDVIKNPLKFNAPDWLLNRRKDPESGHDLHLLTSDLSFARENDIKLMKKIKSYKGLRHAWGLTVRGQKTRSNFRRNKGKTSLGVQKKKVDAGRSKDDDKKKK